MFCLYLQEFVWFFFASDYCKVVTVLIPYDINFGFVRLHKVVTLKMLNSCGNFLKIL